MPQSLTWISQDSAQQNIQHCWAVVAGLYCRKSPDPAKLCIWESWLCIRMCWRAWCLLSSLVCPYSAAVLGSVFQCKKFEWVSEITLARMVVTLPIGMFVCGGRWCLGRMNSRARISSRFWHLQVYESAGSWISEVCSSARLVSSVAGWGTSQLPGLPPGECEWYRRNYLNFFFSLNLLLSILLGVSSNVQDLEISPEEHLEAFCWVS